MLWFLSLAGLFSPHRSLAFRCLDGFVLPGPSLYPFCTWRCLCLAVSALPGLPGLRPALYRSPGETNIHNIGLPCQGKKPSNNQQSANSTYQQLLIKAGAYSTMKETPSLCAPNSGAYMHCMLEIPLEKLPRWLTLRGYSNTQVPLGR
jgi:hypothetical protein